MSSEVKAGAAPAVAAPQTLAQPAAAAPPQSAVPAGESVVSVRDAGKHYRIYRKPHHRLLQALFKSGSYYRDFWALRHISFEIKRGETIGILGQNGSGKSTLLQMVAGTLPPSEGSIEVRGRVAALLELGSGFNPEFSGRENVYLNGSILGFSREQMSEKFESILAFSEIGDFIDQPVKTYSSGMVVRLAFSVAINVNPEILIVDEALAVGDARFQQRCMSRIREMRDRGISIMFVTHDIDACKRLCQRVYVLNKGSVVNSGPADAMASWYLGFLTSLDSSLVRMSSERPKEQDTQADDGMNEFVWFRHGDGAGTIESCELLSLDGSPAKFVYMDERCIIRFKILFNTKADAPILGFYLKDRLGTDLFGINTLQEKIAIPPVEPGTRITIDFEIPISLKPGYYSISPGLAYNQFDLKYMDYVDHMLVFKVLDRDPERIVFGLFHPQVKVRMDVEKPN